MRYNIHCEKLYDDEVWKRLTIFLRKKGKRTHLFLMAPQPTYLKAVLGYRGTKEELVAKLSKRYRILAKAQQRYRFKVGIHISLSDHPNLISEVEKDHSIKYVYGWVCKWFKDVDNISFTNFKYDKYIGKLCRANRIRIINDEWGATTINDYDLLLPSNTISKKWLGTVIRKLKGQKPKY